RAEPGDPDARARQAARKRASRNRPARPGRAGHGRGGENFRLKPHYRQVADQRGAGENQGVQRTLFEKRRSAARVGARIPRPSASITNAGGENPPLRARRCTNCEALTMRCTHAEKLVPLFAGGDLPAREADALRRHLKSCANCRRLAAEFEVSRDWLRGFAAPQFDEAMLDDMRDSVLRDIGRIKNRAQWLQWIVPGWNLRFMASMAALLLIIFFAAYVHRGRQSRMVPDKDNIVKTNQG